MPSSTKILDELFWIELIDQLTNNKKCLALMSEISLMKYN